jgi:hypothetical protein
MRLSILLLNPIVGFCFFKDFPREDAAACGRMRLAQLNWNTFFFFFVCVSSQDTYLSVFFLDEWLVRFSFLFFNFLNWGIMSFLF